MAVRFLSAVLLVVLIGSADWAQAQIKDTPSDKGARLGPPVTQKLKVGVIIKAEGGPCQNLIATLPVPADWPEQTVKIVDEELSPTVQSLRYRTSAGHLKQMLVEVPMLPAGQVAKALITLEVSHSPQLAPDDPASYKIPKKLDRRLQIYTGSSLFIEVRHPKIVALAKQLTADKDTAWEQVRALYDWVQDNIKVTAGDLKGAAKALNDKTGDAEDLTSLFVALCRASKVPARTVWVPQHCYPEFYLVDEAGEGYWFPCQVGGTRSFGQIDETRPILLKGDNFKDPERRAKNSASCRSSSKGARGRPAEHSVHPRSGRAVSNGKDEGGRMSKKTSDSIAFNTPRRFNFRPAVASCFSCSLWQFSFVSSVFSWFLLRVSESLW